MELLLFAVVGLFWGSFLNLCGYRLLSGDSLLGLRSQCPHCKNTIRAYDLVPLFSYVLLGRQCRDCGQSISWLYPAVELLGALAGVALWYDLSLTPALPATELVGRGVAYAILLSGFIVATRTDLEALVVPRVVIVGMGVVGTMAAACSWLPVTILASIIGGVVGYGSLWLLNALSLRVTGREGIGEGDMELLAVIGIFWGPLGVWAVAFMSSLFGVACALVYLALTGQSRYTRIPFIPFMALSVLAYFFLQEEIVLWLWAI